MMHQIMSLFTNEWVYWTLFAAYCVTILSIVGVVLSENRNPLKSLAWVCVLIMFPVGGLVLYIFFGRFIKNTQMISRRKRRRLMRNEVPNPEQEHAETRGISRESRQIMRLGHSMTGSPVFEANHVEIITDGKNKFETLMADIANARKFINLQYYIIENDSTGQRLGCALAEAADRGVKVRVIYDDIGSMSLRRSKILKKMRAHGVEIFPFSHVAFPPFATRINWRNHRKVGVIDGVVGYIGGMNIADRYMEGNRSFAKWRDTHLRVTGPGVNALAYSFAVDWNFMGRPLLDDKPSAHKTQPRPGALPASLQLVTSGPTSRWSNVAFMLLKAISAAKRRVFIQTPYFLPTESLLRTLQAAALAKVDVRVMMPAKSDSRILTSASRSFVWECLRAGIKFYLYQGGMLHAKTIIVDEELASVGSTNFDFRSFEHNFEGNFFIYSHEVNARLVRDFIADQRECVRVKAAQWRRRPLTAKIYESITRLLSPIL